MLTAAPPLTDPAAIRQTLRQKIQAALAPNGAHMALKRITLPIAPHDPIAWVQAQAHPVKLCWSRRNAQPVMAGLGIADAYTNVAADYVALQTHLNQRFQHAPADIRYYGGLRFDATQPSASAWQAFGGLHFVLPRFELHTHRGGTTLICNVVLPEDSHRVEAILEEVETLVFKADLPESPIPNFLSRVNQPDEGGWATSVTKALAAFARGDLEKIVLAREARFQFADVLDPFALLAQLAADTPHCYHFGFQPAAGTAFIGASPERLYRRHHRSLRSEAVAGTRPRSADWLADLRFKTELLHSEKDRREHAFVRESIRTGLAPLTTELAVDETVSALELASKWHLCAEIIGTLRDGVTDADLLAALHPTPAVGGVPRPEALAAIAEQEPFDRGWYAGPFGWIGPDGAEFTVAIRSGLVRETELALFSGAGIVEGSTAEAEWHEIEHKLADFLKVLHLDLARV